jgi:hypothetical protein
MIGAVCRSYNSTLNKFIARVWMRGCEIGFIVAMGLLNNVLLWLSIATHSLFFIFLQFTPGHVIPMLQTFWALPGQITLVSYDLHSLQRLCHDFCAFYCDYFLAHFVRMIKFFFVLFYSVLCIAKIFSYVFPSQSRQEIL